MIADAPAIPPMMTVPVFRGDGRIDYEERGVPEPAAGELLLRVGANALCGTDRLQHRFGSPVTPGHEAAGTVVATGERTLTAVGTTGVVYLMHSCGQCRSCRLGHTNQCLHKLADLGFTRDGGYAPYELVPESTFFPTEKLPADEATLLLDVMGTSGHAITRAASIRPDIESVLVAGAGPIGLGVVAMAKVVLGRDLPVFVSDTATHRLALAERLGAVGIDLGSTSVPEALRDHGLADADVAFDAAGRREARASLMGSLGRRGVLVCIGHGQELSLQVSPDLIAPERAVLGSEYFPFGDLRRNLELLKSHRGALAPIITHRFECERLDEAFELFLAGETGKVVINP